MMLSEMPGFLVAGGQAGKEIHARDWTSAPAGPPPGWPSAIKSLLSTWLGSPQAMFVAWGPELCFVFNDAYRPFLGARAPWAMGRPFEEIWTEIWSDIQPIIQRALQGHGSRFEEMPLTMTRNGYVEETWWTFTYMPLRDDAGEVIGMMCTTSEVTSEVQAKRQAGIERESQRKLLQQMPGFVGLLSGPSHVYEYVNDAYKKLTGKVDFVDRTVRDMFPELRAQGIYEMLDKVYTTGEPFAAKAMPIRFAGDESERFVDVLCHPVYNDDRTVSGIFIGGYDVTQRVQAELQLRTLNETLENRVEERTAQLMRAQESLRQSQKLEALGQLTGGVAHDFNNLMTVIGSSVELMRRKNLPDDRRQKYMEAISDTVRRASKLTAQLLAFARRQPLRPEVFDVGRQVEGIAELIRPLVGARVKIEMASPAPLCFAEADINQFETALMNLAINARDAMNGEGFLSIHIEHVDMLPGARRQPGRPGDFVAVSVKDTGTGIAADQIEKIFEPFYTTKSVGKGTGLGLSQVFGFAQQSGGDIHVFSEPGKGSTFTLYLPKATTPPRERPAKEADAECHAADEVACILVVEDNHTVGEFSTAVLQDLGYRTAWATDASKALSMLAQDALRFDLVFSDVIMPGMDGVELAGVIRERYPRLPVVLTSGYSEVLAKDIPRDLHLVQKPYSVDALSQVIRRSIRRRAEPD